MRVHNYFDNILVPGKCDLLLEHEEPEECPICHKGIKPVFIYGFVDTEHLRLFALYECRACHNAFLKSSDLENRNNYIVETKYELSPKKMMSLDFSKYIHGVSEDFIEIYNQAYSAEQFGLSEIAGMGYRKALEFLVKDYLCSKLSDDNRKTKIREKSLSSCINEDINNPNIQLVAKKATWLGNDETHYERKHKDRDINDLKKLINVTVNWIEIELITEDAKSIPKL